MTFFRTAVLIFFGAAAVIAVVVFALGGLSGSFGGDESVGEVVIWGTEDARVIETMLETSTAAAGVDAGEVEYVEVSDAMYERELVNALAAGRGPDLILMDHTMALSLTDKIRPISYRDVSERSFKDSYASGGEIFLFADGILALPVMIDPLVMYWNRSIFASEGIANPPRFWEELFSLSERITMRDDAGNITRSGIALGEFENITNASAILSALIRQAGNPITTLTGQGIGSVLAERLGAPIPPAEAAVRFYTEFSNPVKAAYSWNRSLPADRLAFTSGETAVYFGFASEVTGLRAANPNLDFDVAPLPQTRDAALRQTYGTITGLAVPLGAANPRGALVIASVLAGESAADALATVSIVPSARRDALAATPESAFRSTFNASALNAHGWLSPGTETTDAIFGTLIESVTSGRRSISEAVRVADQQLEQALR